MKSPMFDVLVAIELIEWLLKDLHYRSRDQWFYALHILADTLDDDGFDEDSLKESYWLGFKEGLPPEETTIHEATVEKAMQYKGALSNHDLLVAVKDAADKGALAVECAKAEEGLPGGIHAILDDVSRCFLKAKGLCWRTLSQGTAGIQEGDTDKALGKFLEVTAVGVPEVV